MSNLDAIRGRQVLGFFTNKSGGSVVAGDVVIMDSANDESFTTTTSASSLKKVGVAQETIANNAQGRVLIAGYASLVNVSASATRDYYLFTHTVAKQATSSATYAQGAFGHVIKAGTSPSALIYDETAQASTGVSVTTKGDLQGYSSSAARVPVGGDGQGLIGNSAATLGVGYVGGAPAQVQYNVVNATSCAVTFGSTPASTSIFLACLTVLGNFTISTIVQTNVTWSLLRAKSNGTSARVEIWKGIASGTPGTLVTANPSGSCNHGMSASEWPLSAGLAGTLDQSSDSTGTSAFQNTGIITPTTVGSLALVLFGNSNGTISLGGMAGPFYPLISPTTFMMFGYAWAGKNAVTSGIPVQTSAAWANMIVSVI